MQLHSRVVITWCWARLEHVLDRKYRPEWHVFERSVAREVEYVVHFRKAVRSEHRTSHSRHASEPPNPLLLRFKGTSTGVASWQLVAQPASVQAVSHSVYSRTCIRILVRDPESLLLLRARLSCAIPLTSSCRWTALTRWTRTAHSRGARYLCFSTPLRDSPKRAPARQLGTYRRRSATKARQLGTHTDELPCLPSRRSPLHTRLLPRVSTTARLLFCHTLTDFCLFTFVHRIVPFPLGKLLRCYVTPLRTPSHPSLPHTFFTSTSTLANFSIVTALAAAELL